VANSAPDRRRLWRDESTGDVGDLGHGLVDRDARIVDEDVELAVLLDPSEQSRVSRPAR
jgi:hypothetical protein